MLHLQTHGRKVERRAVFWLLCLEAKSTISYISKFYYEVNACLVTAHPIGHLNSLYKFEISTLRFFRAEMQQKYSFYCRAEYEKPPPSPLLPFS